MATLVSTSLKDRLDKATSRLMSARVEGGRAHITLPVSYPSGSSCAVEIVLDENGCFVSDLGLGRTEAEMLGAETFYDPAARAASKRFGVRYDGLSIFVLRTSMDHLEAAITCIANASAQAAATAVLRAAEDKDRQRNREVYERVISVFGAKRVSKEDEIEGKDAKWPAHNVVRLDSGRRAVFEFVSGHQNAVSSKFMMFSDLSKREGMYSLNSVVPSLRQLGNKGNMLADVSHILPIDAGSEEYRRYAEAA